jgi:hypothetical protein
VSRKTAPSKGEQAGAVIEPLVETESQGTDTGEGAATRMATLNKDGESELSSELPPEAQDALKAWLATKKDPMVEAAYNYATRLSEDAWKSELQFALKTEVKDAHELKEKIEASILKLPQKEHPDPDAGSRKRLDNDVAAICTAAAFERFKALRSETPAGNATTTKEIEKLERRATRIIAQVQSMDQTSRKIVEGEFSVSPLVLLENAAKFVVAAVIDAKRRLAVVPLGDKGRKANKGADAVTRIAALIFRQRTGEPAVRDVDRITHQEGGPFVEWLSELFLLLEIEASADVAARKYGERCKSKDTIKKKSNSTM